MKEQNYRVKVVIKHDNGRDKVATVVTSNSLIEAGKVGLNLICKSEGCPVNAVQKIEVSLMK